MGLVSRGLNGHGSGDPGQTLFGFIPQKYMEPLARMSSCGRLVINFMTLDWFVFYEVDGDGVWD